MPNLRSAAKRMRQNEKRRLRNSYFRSRARTFVRKARLAIEEEDLETARQLSHAAVKALDKAAEKGVIHKNNAARRKSRILKHLAALEKRLSD